jgi:hypothetical protein
MAELVRLVVAVLGNRGAVHNAGGAIDDWRREQEAVASLAARLG